MHAEANWGVCVPRELGVRVCWVEKVASVHADWLGCIHTDGWGAYMLVARVRACGGEWGACLLRRVVQTC